MSPKSRGILGKNGALRSLTTVAFDPNEPAALKCAALHTLMNLSVTHENQVAICRLCLGQLNIMACATTLINEVSECVGSACE